jgi:hypothetical protein
MGLVLYHNTDSVLFLRRSDDPILPCENYLDELTDEVAKEYGADARCTKFAYLALKSMDTRLKKKMEKKKA